MTKKVLEKADRRRIGKRQFDHCGKAHEHGRGCDHDADELQARPFGCQRRRQPAQDLRSNDEQHQSLTHEENLEDAEVLPEKLDQGDHHRKQDGREQYPERADGVGGQMSGHCGDLPLQAVAGGGTGRSGCLCRLRVFLAHIHDEILNRTSP
ncbi:hypothetical protein QW131_14230 [Roseibium salinum]|nr:hypothetical protein [Roseibium salinum]